MKNLIIMLGIAFMLFNGCTSEERTGITILPYPNQCKHGKGVFVLSGTTALVCHGEEARKEASFLLEALKEKNILLAEKEADANVIVLTIDSAMGTGDEGYRLLISKEKIEIGASRPAGLFYGIQSLIQLCQGKEIISLPCVSIEDAPRFRWRGMMLDESRHFFGKEEVKKLLDQMARIKMNRFHWHLTDDQGWRIEIKKYPRLTEVGAWRKDDGSGEWNYVVEPAEEGKPRYGGFYTQEEIREIVAYAAERHITVVPEIEMPGHSTAAITAYPELSCKGKPWKPNSVFFEFSDPLCAGNEKVFEMYEGILEEVISLFPSPYIHVGGDECKKDPWAGCPKCQKRMKTEKLSTLEELQSYFMQRIEKFLVSKGKILIGWDEILEGGLPPRAAVMSWRGMAGGMAAANAGHEVVMSPTDYCYFDYYQGSMLTEPKAIGGYLPLARVYAFDPVPDSLDPAKHHYILGGQCNVWTEYMFTPEHLEYMIFPRLFAMAEVLWTKKENLLYENFLERLVYCLKDLNAKGINYRMLAPEGLGQQLLITSDTVIKIINPMKNQGAVIYYTTDGSEPGPSSAVYKKPIKITSTTCLKARLFLDGKGSHVSQSWIFVYHPHVNGLHCDFYRGSWTMLPDFDSLTPEKSYVVYVISEANPDGVVDDYGLRFRTSYQVDTGGVYTFYISSDDGSRLFIDGQLVIDYDGVHAPGLKTGKVTLEKGMHELKIWFFEAKGGQSLEAGTVNEKGERIPFDPGKMFLKK